MPPTTAQGQVFMGRDFNNQPDYSDEIAFQIDKEIRRIVDESYDTAEDLLVPTGPSWTS
jgi:cell division protease FtsH